MEKAIYITQAAQLNEITSDYSRVYFGAEFCERLTPKWEELKFALEICSVKNLEFSLVTTYFSNEGSECIKSIIDKLSRLNLPIEIIVNDWGLMHYLTNNSVKFPQIELVVGRLLSKLPRDPRIYNLYSSFSEIQKECIGKTSISFKWVQEYWKSVGVKRLEIDNVYQDLFFPQNAGISYSLYYPYVYISTTRNCLVNSCDKEIQLSRVKKVCSFQCREYTFELGHPILPQNMLCKGNAYFYENIEIDSKLTNKAIDRLVYQISL